MKKYSHPLRSAKTFGRFPRGPDPCTHNFQLSSRFQHQNRGTARRGPLSEHRPAPSPYSGTRIPGTDVKTGLQNGEFHGEFTVGQWLFEDVFDFFS